MNTVQPGACALAIVSEKHLQTKLLKSKLLWPCCVQSGKNKTQPSISRIRFSI